jgi:S-adenosylmethionine:tRNA ribosyltransferase-isomerase
VSALVFGGLREASEPPEASGSGRDDVALLVASRGDGALVHARFAELPDFLEPGDLLVVNTSATLPAALPASLAGREVELRLSTPAADGAWVVELRSGDGSPLPPPAAGARIALPGGAHADLLVPFAGSERLSIARFELDAPLEEYLHRHGHPIRYRYVGEPWPLAAYQTVPSAGRPFTTALVTELVARGVLIAPLTLHTGVSSLERGEQPYPERFRVPASGRGRVIAVGTTVVRALETVARPDGTAAAGEGWTSLVLTPETGIHVVDGLLTGWHDPEASHLQILEAIAGAELIERSYHEAQARGYRWHEFGDLHLILPAARRGG